MTMPPLPPPPPPPTPFPFPSSLLALLPPINVFSSPPPRSFPPHFQAPAPLVRSSGDISSQMAANIEVGGRGGGRKVEGDSFSFRSTASGGGVGVGGGKEKLGRTKISWQESKNAAKKASHARTYSLSFLTSKIVFFPIFYRALLCAIASDFLASEPAPK